MNRQTFLFVLALVPSACSSPSSEPPIQGGTAGAVASGGSSGATGELPSGGSPEVPTEVTAGAGSGGIAAAGGPSAGGSAGEGGAAGEGASGGFAAGGMGAAAGVANAGGGVGGAPPDPGYGVSGCWITHTNSGQTRLDLVEQGSTITGTQTYSGTARDVEQGHIDANGMTFGVNWGSYNCDYTFDTVSPTMLSGEGVCGTGIGSNRQNMTADRTCP